MAADGWRALGLVLWREYMQRVRSLSFLLSTLLTPIFFLAIAVIPPLLAAPNLIVRRHLAIACADPALAAELRVMLAGKAAVGRYVITIMPIAGAAERTRLVAATRAGRLDGFIWLDEPAIAGGKVQFVTHGDSDFLERDYLRSTLGWAVTRDRLGRRGLENDAINRALAPIKLDTIALGARRRGQGASGYVVGIAVVFLLEITLLSYGLMVMRSVLDDKASRVMEVLLCAATPRELMAGKVLGIGALGVTQLAIWAVMGAAIAGSAAWLTRGGLGALLPSQGLDPLSIALYCAFFILGFLLYSAVYAAAGAAFNSVDEAQQWNFLITLPLVLSGVFVFYLAAHPQAPLAVALSLIPPFTPTVMSMRVAAGGAPGWQVALAMALMAASVYAAIAVSSRIYRVGILMYGKKPAIAEILRWLRYT